MINKNYLIILGCFFYTFVSADEAPNRIGYAYDKNTKELIYTESHFEIIDKGLVENSKVIYKDPMDNIFAHKTANFSVNPFMPEFSLNNNRTGHKEETQYIQIEYKVIFTKSSKEPLKNSLLELPKNGISDAGFDNFIVEHWDELISGDVLKRDFLIPSMMGFVKFRIYQDKIVDEEGESLRIINIEPNNFLIRTFAGTTKLFYESNEPNLRRFDGVSNMRDSNGNNYKVVINYVESQPVLYNQ